MSLKNISAALRIALGRWIISVSSKRSKRNAFIASLFAFAKGETALDEETAAKLNAVMALAGDDNSIGLGVHLSSAIWCDKHGKHLVPMDLLNPEVMHNPDPVGMRRTVDAIIAAVPAFIRYGKDEEIAEDLAKLLNFENTLPVPVK